MVNEFRLPDIGEGLTDAEVVAWHVAVGDDVTVDQLLVEVETAKAIVEITSPYAGAVLHLGAAAGEELAVGEILLVIGDPGEVWESGAGGAADDVSPVADLPVSDAGSPASGGRVKAVPIVRKLARDRGVDLSTITGTGPGGAITRDDVLGAAPSGSERAAAPSNADERVPMSRIRRTIAENMSRSWREIPHVTVQADIDATRLLEVHRDVRRQLDGPFPLEAIVTQAVLPLLKEYPEFNATLDGADLILRRHYDVGFAVDTRDGLVVVVTRGTDGMDRDALASEILQLAEAARTRKAAPGELAGQTFTISNIGALGGGPGTPIIPWGTTAILSIGRAIHTPVARDGGIFIAPVAPLNLSYDHRVIDGALGQRFLSSLTANLEGIDTFI
jgi:pyruvate dehydrogenase E2 component (dihydrolipoamide acetyltransferase)